MSLSDTLKLLNFSVFLRSHLFLLPVLFLFYQQYGITVGDFFLLQGLSALLCLLLDVPCGYLADIYSKKKVLIFSGTLLFLRFALLYFFPSYWIIFLGEALYAVVISTFVGTADSYIYELLKMNGKTVKMLKRYGRLYFYVSLGTSVSSLAGAYLFDLYGADTVILITMIYVALSTMLLFLLPELPKTKRQIRTLPQRCHDLASIIRKSFKQRPIKNLMIFSGFLTAAYQIFMWSMQPLMKLALVPVFLFGVVFFINHLARASGSFFAHKLTRALKLKKLGYLSYGGFIVSFIAAIALTHTTNVYVSIPLLVFICLMIGFQVAFLISAISHIHEKSSSSERATFASINSMWGRLLSAICLILSKFILDQNSLQTNMIIFMILFSFAFVPLKNFVSDIKNK